MVTQPANAANTIDTIDMRALAYAAVNLGSA